MFCPLYICIYIIYYIFNHRVPKVSLLALSSVNVNDVIDAIRQLPDKSSAADQMPTSVLTQVVHLLAPRFIALFNSSLAAGHFTGKCSLHRSQRKQAWIPLMSVQIDRRPPSHVGAMTGL